MRVLLLLVILFVSSIRASKKLTVDLIENNKTAITSGGPILVIVLVNGILATKGWWSYMAKYSHERFTRSIGHEPWRKVLILQTDGNSGLKSLNGINNSGNRVADEVRRLYDEYLITDKGKPIYISFIGHSMGGLVSRYAIGKLYESGWFQSSRVRPLTFMTVSTPNLGVQRLSDSRVNFGLAKRIFNTAGKFAGGRSLQQMFGADKNRILQEMARPDSSFMQALELFPHRTLVGILADKIVPITSALMMPSAKIKQLYCEIINANTEHCEINGVGIIWFPESSSQSKDVCIPEKFQGLLLLADACRNLNSLNWRRIFIHFEEKSMIPFATHASVVAISPFHRRNQKISIKGKYFSRNLIDITVNDFLIVSSSREQ